VKAFGGAWPRFEQKLPDAGQPNKQARTSGPIKEPDWSGAGAERRSLEPRRKWISPAPNMRSARVDGADAAAAV